MEDRKMSGMTPAEAVKKYNIEEITHNGEPKLKVPPSRVPNDAGERQQLIEYMGANKSALLAQIRENKAEQAAKEAATIHYWVCGWEAHEVSVDTRFPLGPQFEGIANYYKNDVTLEAVRNGYYEHLESQKAKAKKQIEYLERFVCENSGATMTWAEARAAEKYYNDINNEGGDGYVPHYVSVDEVDDAKKSLKILKEEQK